MKALFHFKPKSIAYAIWPSWKCPESVQNPCSASDQKVQTALFSLVTRWLKNLFSEFSSVVRPGEVKEEAPKKGGQTKNKEASLGKARKLSPAPHKQARPQKPSGHHAKSKSKIKGRRNSSADAKAYRKTKAGFRSPRVKMVWFPQLKKRQ